MSEEALSTRVTRLLLEAEGLETSLSQHVWKFEQWQSQHDKQAPPQHFIEGDAELRPPFGATLEALYVATVCLIDARGLTGYLRQFYSVVGETFNGETAQEFDPADDWPPYPRSTYLSKLRLFLAPLGVDSGSDAYRQKAGIKCLETVLENTAAILRQLKVEPKSEPQVYRPVREVLKLIFEGARNPPAGRFSKSLKNFAPDILIPDLFAAVEYKYVPNEATLKSALAGIAEDVGGYTGDTQYKLFYAVFYFADNFLSRKRFLTFWAEKKFPKEWIPIFVVGK
jgi:hypothetical protein